MHLRYNHVNHLIRLRQRRTILLSSGSVSSSRPTCRNNHQLKSSSQNAKDFPWTQHEKVPNQYWEEASNRRAYFDWLGNKLGITSWSDWYKVTVSQVNNNGGSFMIKKYYNSSVTQALMAMYPHHPWVIWKFRSVPQGYWQDITNQRVFMDWVGSQLNVKTHEDWYKIPFNQIMPLARKLLPKYKFSVFRALSTIYPEYDWQPWKFEHMPRNYWQDSDITRYLEYVAQQYSITSVDDWLAFPAQHFPKKNLLKRFGGLLPMLAKFHPQFQNLKLGPSKDLTFHSYKHLLGNTSKAQRLLHKHIQNLFPHKTILLDYSHPDLFLPTTGPMELDIYLPELSLALEYQGQQHFTWTYMVGSPSALQERDVKKRDACEKAGITLVAIPYWWNTQLGSLLSTLLEHKPDIKDHIPAQLISQATVPIPSNPPTKKTRRK